MRSAGREERVMEESTAERMVGQAPARRSVSRTRKSKRSSPPFGPGGPTSSSRASAKRMEGCRRSSTQNGALSRAGSFQPHCTLLPSSVRLSKGSGPRRASDAVTETESNCAVSSASGRPSGPKPNSRPMASRASICTRPPMMRPRRPPRAAQAVRTSIAENLAAAGLGDARGGVQLV